ncbi:MAG: ABC transporter substrate-binding protein [Thermoleophilaceae bacterium]
MFKGRLRWALMAVLALTAVLALAACGRDDDDDNGGGDGDVATAPGFDGTTIRLGVVTPLSGPVAVIGNPLTNGNRVWFEYVNEEQGGIGGRYRVELVERDSRYDPATAVQQYNRVKDDVTMFVQVLGTPIINAVLPQLNRDQIVAGPATLDSEWVREQYLAPVGGPYQIQVINAVDYYIREEGEGNNICAMIQDDPYGEAGLEGLEFAAEQYEFEIAEVARYRAGDQDVTGQIGQLAQAQCEMVLYVGLPSDAGTVLGTAAQAEFAPRWIGQSPSWVAALGESPLAEYLQQRFWVIAEGPEWGDESVPGMAAMIERVEQFAPDQEPDYYFTFGYSQARLISEILEKAVENGDLSREGIVEAMNNLGTFSTDGLGGDYEYGPPEERNPPRQSTLYQVNPESPFGLEALETNFSSDAAEAFEFE